MVDSRVAVEHGHGAVEHEYTGEVVVCVVIIDKGADIVFRYRAAVNGIVVDDADTAVEGHVTVEAEVIQVVDNTRRAACRNEQFDAASPQLGKALQRRLRDAVTVEADQRAVDIEKYSLYHGTKIAKLSVDGLAATDGNLRGRPFVLPALLPLWFAGTASFMVC